MDQDTEDRGHFHLFGLDSRKSPRWQTEGMGDIFTGRRQGGSGGMWEVEGLKSCRASGPAQLHAV